jgi:hypothetical protein
MQPLVLQEAVAALFRGLQSVVGIEVDPFGIPYEISDALFDDAMRRNTTQFEQDFLRLS